MEPEELLFTDRNGSRTSLQDVISDGLDHDYSERYAALLRLMREGLPAHRLYACIMLASWGVSEGFHTLIRWAREPSSTPWAGEPVTFDRFYGADSSFEMLADAVRVTTDAEHGDELRELRAEAVRALLGIYDQVYFARTLALLLDEDRGLSATAQAEIARAVDSAVAASSAAGQHFDMASQAAFLLSPLAAFDDEHAARAAQALLDDHPGRSRVAREIAYALGSGSGPGTQAILEQLAASPSPSVRADALQSLARRGV
jgi:hypothetical protein